MLMSVSLQCYNTDAKKNHHSICKGQGNVSQGQPNTRLLLLSTLPLRQEQTFLVHLKKNNFLIWHRVMTNFILN